MYVYIYTYIYTCTSLTTKPEFNNTFEARIQQHILSISFQEAACIRKYLWIVRMCMYVACMYA